MDIESQLRSLSQSVPEGQLRSFECECSKRLQSFCNDSLLHELISLGQTRSVRHVDANEISALRGRSTQVYDSIYPSYGDPSVLALALSAGGEVAFTDSSLNAAINSSGFAAEAIAKKAALEVGDEGYDAAFEAA